MKEIKPCPFCGNKEVSLRFGFEFDYIKCENCGAEGPRGYNNFGALEAWNTGIMKLNQIEKKSIPVYSDENLKKAMENLGNNLYNNEDNSFRNSIHLVLVLIVEMIKNGRLQ